LRELIRRRNVKLQVIPKTVTAHAGLGGWFCILEFPFPAEQPNLVYTDGPGGNVYLEDPEDVRRSTMIFGQLSVRALSATESSALIDSLIEANSEDIK